MSTPASVQDHRDTRTRPARQSAGSARPGRRDPARALRDLARRNDNHDAGSSRCIRAVTVPVGALRRTNTLLVAFDFLDDSVGQTVRRFVLWKARDPAAARAATGDRRLWASVVEEPRPSSTRLQPNQDEWRESKMPTAMPPRRSRAISRNDDRLIEFDESLRTSEERHMHSSAAPNSAFKKRDHAPWNLVAQLVSSIYAALASPALHPGRRWRARQTEAVAQSDLSSIRVVDALNLFPNVGALIYFAEPNDFGIPPGPLVHCTVTLIHERAALVAGHCTAPTVGGLLPFIKAFVTFSPNALDRSTWRAVSGFAFHPSLPPCPPPVGCTFQGLDPGILDIGLVFWSSQSEISHPRGSPGWESSSSPLPSANSWLSRVTGSWTHSLAGALPQSRSGTGSGGSSCHAFSRLSTTTGRPGLCLGSFALAIPGRQRSFRVVSWRSQATAARACATPGTIGRGSIQRRRRTGSVRQSRTRSVDSDDRTERGPRCRHETCP